MNLVEECRRIVVLQVGCGGTGSWLVPLASKLLNNIKRRLPVEVNVTYLIVDDDIVEERNILRQNFSDWDIGKGKAMALTSKYCYNFENMRAITHRLKSKTDFEKLVFDPVDNHLDGTNYFDVRRETLVIVLGCVDNNSSRHLIDRLTKSFNKNFLSPVIYLDSGNLLYNGQIVAQSYGFNEFLIDRLSNHNQDDSMALFKQVKNRKKINFKKMFPLEEKTEVQQSCAFFGDQSQAVNSMAANLLFCNLQKILVNSEIPPAITTFNSAGYSTFEV
jgi:hypothetical protein